MWIIWSRVTFGSGSIINVQSATLRTSYQQMNWQSNINDWAILFHLYVWWAAKDPHQPDKAPGAKGVRSMALWFRVPSLQLNFHLYQRNIKLGHESRWQTNRDYCGYPVQFQQKSAVTPCPKDCGPVRKHFVEQFDAQFILLLPLRCTGDNSRCYLTQ